MARVDDETTTTCYRHPSEPTLVRCSSCERPICTRCMVDTPVGIRCPECAGRRSRTLVPRAAGGGAQPVVTIALIVANVLAFGLERGGDERSWAWVHGALTGNAVDGGDWWRIASAAFLHANIVHLLMNLYALWLLGSRLEQYLGSLRFSAIYVLGMVAGSAGALLLTAPNRTTVGASGAIFALLGALLVLERQGVLLIGPVMPLIVINAAFTLFYPNISIGGHLGGFVGGVLAALALGRFGRGHVAYSRLGPETVLALLGILALAIAACVVAVA